MPNSGLKYQALPHSVAQPLLSSGVVKCDDTGRAASSGGASAVRALVSDSCDSLWTLPSEHQSQLLPRKGPSRPAEGLRCWEMSMTR